MRFKSVTVASTINGENTSNGNHQGQIFVEMPYRPSVAARNPSGIEPASPIKTLAGEKLKNRKPSAAPAIVVESVAIGIDVGASRGVKAAASA